MGKYTKKTKKSKKFLIAFLVLLVLGLAGSVFVLWGTEKTASSDVAGTETDFQAEQEVSQNTEMTLPEELTAMPWDEAGAKQPADYTWEEYEALTGPQQQVFRDCLGTDGYTVWLDGMRKHANIKPWDELGAKQPADYSWEEYEELTTAQQIAFQRYLDLEAFSEWLYRVQSQMEDIPWNEPGAKQPADYTWAEFENLTGAQQMLFQYHLGAENFSKWMENAQTQVETNPWDAPGAKQPADYTIAEFEALTGSQQMAFQNHLGAAAFDSWLKKDQDQSQSKANPWDAPGAKQPAEYTMGEFEALTASQKMDFQNYLGSAGFDAWLNKYQSQMEANPWDTPGAKQPAEYTWEEFEALAGAQQMAFQNHLGAEDFETWLNMAQGLPEADTVPES